MQGGHNTVLKTAASQKSFVQGLSISEVVSEPQGFHVVWSVPCEHVHDCMTIVVV